MNLKKRNGKIGIIGAGVFGCSAAIELARNRYPVVIFDRANNILDGASTTNHLRHHYGFHYPRSKETVEEIKAARLNFESEYGNSLSEPFEDYYGVSKVGSKTDAKGFIKFCNDMKLPYEIACPEKEFMDLSKISVCVRTPERVYDPDILKGMILQKFMGLPIELRLNHNIVNGRIDGKKKVLESLCGERTEKHECDVVINATYSNFNQFNKLFGFNRKRLLYELVELLELYVPADRKIGLTVMDGEFSALLPRGEKGTFTLGHVRESVLVALTSDDLDTFNMSAQNTKSNKGRILEEGIKDFPFLKNAEIVKSLFVTRVVKPYVDATDERPSEITCYGNGVYSIFGGKVITCVDISKKITSMVIKEDGH